MSKSDETGMERPINTSYQARAPIDDPDGKLVARPARHGQDLRPTGSPSASAVWRYLVRTFNFKL